MSAGWLIYALVTGALITAAASALDAVARARRWPSRWTWAASLLAMLVVMAATVARRAESLSTDIVAQAAATISVATAPQGLTLTALARAASAMLSSSLGAGVATVAHLLPASVVTVAPLAWLALAGTALLLLGAVHARLRRARRSWPSTDLHGRRVRVAPTVGPAVVGIVRPEIVVPQWLLERGATEQRLVLAHEDEHVRGRDHLLLGGACVAVALMPWHPAAWWSLARLRLAIELDCDARVLRRGVPARSYGEMLIDLAGQCSGFRVGATALADKTTHLERRLLAMRPITNRLSLARGAVLCAAAALSLAAACEARVPTSAEIQSMDAASAERTIAKTGLIDADHGSMQFYVNGALVTAQQAHAIPAADIATVNVQKGAKDGESLIRITTVATSANGMKYRSADPAAAKGEAGAPGGLEGLHRKMMSSHGFDGVVFIDGARADIAALHRLTPKDIAGVEVIKGQEATLLSADPAAKNGVIRVTTVGARSR